MAESLPADAPYFSPVAGVGWMWIVTMSLVLVTCNISFQATIQIGFAAKNESHARVGFLLAALLILPVSFMAALVGVAAKASFPEMEHAATALPRMVGSLHPAVAGVTLAALWAADVSTACGLLLSSSTVITRDVIARFLRPDLSERTRLRVSRIVVLVIGGRDTGTGLADSWDSEGSHAGTELDDRPHGCRAVHVPVAVSVPPCFRRLDDRSRGDGDGSLASLTGHSCYPPRHLSGMDRLRRRVLDRISIRPKIDPDSLKRAVWHRAIMGEGRQLTSWGH